MSKPLQTTRRETLRSLVGASLLLPGLVSDLLRADAPDAQGDPLSPKPPLFRGKASRVIFIFSNGGVSHMDTFDPKPKLFEADGKTVGIGGGLSNQQRRLLRPGWQFRPGGRCGTMVSEPVELATPSGVRLTTLSGAVLPGLIMLMPLSL
jgi:hypothetical protein